MDVLIKTLIIFSVILGELRCGHALFDIDELKSVNYGIDILNEPVVFKPEVCIFLTNIDICQNVKEKNISRHNLFSTTAEFRPPNTLFHKNLNSLNVATVMISLFTGGIGKLNSDLFLALVVEFEP